MSGAVFAIPGDKNQRTGGYIYDATVLRELNEIGCPATYLRLPDSFPEPSEEDLITAHEALNAVPAGRLIIVDGLALGAMDPVRLGRVQTPIVALVHHPLGLETGVEPKRARAMILNETQVLAQVAHVIVTSSHVADTLASDFDVPSGRITVAQPGFERGLPVKTPVAPPMILSVGLLSPRKGHDVLLDALAEIADLEWQARIVGRAQDAAYAQALQDQARDLGIADRATFVGEIEEAALQEHYRQATLFALATRYEGYGMVLGEAMMHGLPVVSCDVGAVPGTVGAAATLVPADDPIAFSNAMRTLLENQTAAAMAAEASLTRAKSLPTWQDTARVIADVIESVTL